LEFTVGPLLYPGSTFVRQTFQTTDVHQGSFAVKIITRNQSGLGIAPGVLTNAQPTVDVSHFNPSDPLSSIHYVGGTAITRRVGTVYAWVKYFAQSSDNGEIVVQAHTTVSGKDSIIGVGDVSVPALGSYTIVPVSVSYIATSLNPQSVIISLFSSAPGSAATADSSTMYIDDVSMEMVDVPGVEQEKETISCYPNPGRGVIRLTGPADKPTRWQLYDVNGKRVASKIFTGSTALDVSDIAPGNYAYIASDDKGIVIQKGKYSIEK
jgi:hypothetical protein